MRKTARNCILIILAFLTTLFLAVGFSTWIILNEKNISLTPFKPIETAIDKDGVPELTKIYAGNESTLTSSITNGIKVKAGETDLTNKGIFDIEFNWDHIYTATSTSTDLKANVEVSFNVKEQYKYVYAEPDPVEIPIFLEYVAYWKKSSSSKVYYSTIDYAITNTASNTSNDTIYVDPTATNVAVTAKTIKTATELKKGDTLIIPYSGGDSEKDYKSQKKQDVDSNNKAIPEPNAYDNSTYLKNLVTLNTNLTINGTLTIGGIYSAGGGGFYTGHTCSDHSQLTLGNEGKLTVNGTVNSYGFIKGHKKTADEDEPSIVFNNGSTLLMPFVLYEFRGGTVSSTLQKSDDTFYCTPFLRFSFVNIIGSYRINYGATAKANACMVASSMSAEADTEVISTKNSSLLQLTNSKAYVDVTYTPWKDCSTNDLPVNATNPKDSVKDIFGKMKLTFNGGATLNSLKIEKSGVSVNSENAYLPISYIYDITLTNGTYNVSTQDLSIFPGGQLKIDSNANLIGENLIAYSTSPEQGAAGYFAYPTDNTLNGSGKLIVNGSLTLDNLGGNVTTTSNTAKITVNNAMSVITIDLLTNYEPSNNAPDYTDHPNANNNPIDNILDASLNLDISKINLDFEYYKTFYQDLWITEKKCCIYFKPRKETTTLTHYNGGSDYNSKGTYYSIKKADGTFAWYCVDFNVVFDAQGGKFGTDDKLTINVKDEIDDNLGANGGYIVTYPTTNPTRAHYTFSHWCTNKNCTNGNTCSNMFANNTPVFEKTTIYAIWTANTYTVQYDITFDTGITQITKNNDSFSATNPLTPTLPTIDGKNFFGWYSDEGMTKPITQITTALLDNGTLTADNNNVIKVYGKFVNDYKVTFYVNNSEIASEFGSDTYHQEDHAKPNEVYSEEDYANVLANAKKFDENKAITVYFAGWNTKADGSGTVWTADMPITANIQLYAQWTKKHVLSFNTTTNNGNVQVTAPKDVYLITGQSHDLSEYTATLTANDELMDKTKYFGGWYNGETLVTSISINGNTTLTAKWIDKTKVEFLKGEQNAFTNETYYLFDGQDISTSEIIQNAITDFNNNTQNTKLFDGWKDESGNTYSEVIVSADSSAPKSFTAQWKSKLEIKFVDNEGIFTSETHYPTDEQLPFKTPTTIQNSIKTQNSDTTKKRYFVGWSIDGGATIYSEDIEVSSEESITFTAVWDDKYCITINHNDNTAKVEKVYWIPAMDYTTPATPTKTGYVFTHWTITGGLLDGETAKASETLNLSETDDDEVTLTADYEKLVKVDIDLDGGTLSGVATTQYVRAGIEFVTLGVPTKTGYLFTHWTVGGGTTHNGENITDTAIVLSETIGDTVTLTAVYEQLVTVTINLNGGTLSGVETTQYVSAGEPFVALGTPTKTNWKFKHWAVKGGTHDDETITNTAIVLSDSADNDVTLTAVYNPIVTFSGSNYTLSNKDGFTNPGDAVESETTIKFKVTPDDNYTLDSVKVGETTLTADSNDVYSVEITEPTTITISTTKKSSGSLTCLAEGTLITLADGTKRAVQDIRKGDFVMSFDHLTGKLTTNRVIIVVRTASDFYKNIFVFDDGTELATINEHGIFDLNLNKYVNIDHLNYQDYIGHNFVSIDSKGNIGTKKLINVISTYESGYKYDIVTNETLNYVAEDTLSVTHVLVDIINTFEFGEDLKFDAEKMQTDIEKYGLYTYDEWAEYCDISVFEEYNIPIMKIGVLKGLYTQEYIIYLINTFVLNDDVQIT